MEENEQVQEVEQDSQQPEDEALDIAEAITSAMNERLAALAAAEEDQEQEGEPEPEEETAEVAEPEVEQETVESVESETFESSAKGSLWDSLDVETRSLLLSYFGRPLSDGEVREFLVRGVSGVNQQPEEQKQEEDVPEEYWDETYTAKRVKQLEQQLRDLNSQLEMQRQHIERQAADELRQRVLRGRQQFIENHPELTVAEVDDLARFALEQGFLDVKLAQGADPTEGTKEVLETAYRVHPKLEQKWLESRLAELRKVEQKAQERKRNANSLATGGRVPPAPSAKLPSNASELDFAEFLRMQVERLEPPISG